MQITFKVTRQNPGVRPPVVEGSRELNDPLVKAVVLHVSFRREMEKGLIDYDFSGKAILSFIDGKLNDEYCDIRGSITAFPASCTKICGGCVTYNNLQGSTPAEGLQCMYLGLMQLPGPTYRSFLPQLPGPQEIQPTLQQQQNWKILLKNSYNLVLAAAFFIFDAEGWP